MQVLLRISECFGGNYLTLVMLPIFRSASGNDFDDVHMSFGFSNRVRGTCAKCMWNSIWILAVNVAFVLRSSLQLLVKKSFALTSFSWELWSISCTCGGFRICRNDLSTQAFWFVRRAAFYSCLPILLSQDSIGLTHLYFHIVEESI